MNIETLLKRYLNLTEREICILVYLLSYGRKSVKDVSTATGIDISRAYETLNYLYVKKLVIKYNDRPATYLPSSKVLKNIVDIVNIHLKELSDVNRLIKELSTKLLAYNRPDDEQNKNELLALTNINLKIAHSPFSRVYDFTNINEYLESYKEVLKSKEYHLIVTSNQFTTTVSRFINFGEGQLSHFLTRDNNLSYVRIIIYGDIDLVTITDLLSDRPYKRSFFKVLKDRTVEMRRIDCKNIQIRVIFAFTDNQLFFPLMMPNDNPLVLIRIDDWSLLQTYKNYFWKLWNIASPILRIDKGETIVEEKK